MAKRTITKRELCERIARQTGLTQVAVKASVQGFVDAIMEELAKGNRLEFRDFGVFDSRIQTARKARNPKTGEEVYVPAKAIAYFKVGKRMEELIQKALPIVQSESGSPEKEEAPASGPSQAADEQRPQSAGDSSGQGTQY